MPHTLRINTALNEATAAVRVAIAEDGSYDHAPKLEQQVQKLEQVVQEWPTLIELAVDAGGVEALDQGAGFPAILEAAKPLLDELQSMRERAEARVSHSAVTAANEAMGRIAELIPLMHQNTVREVLAAGNQDSGNYGLAGPGLR